MTDKPLDWFKANVIKCHVYVGVVWLQHNMG